MSISGTPKRRMPGSRAIMALILREMTTTYGRSPGGYLWAFLDPIGGVVVLTVVLSFAFAAPPLGSSFALFYATGFLAFTMYMSVSQAVGMSIRYSRPLLAYPNVTYMDALIARLLLNMVTQTLVAILVLGGIILFFAPEATIDFLAVMNALGMIVALSFGVGVMNCFLMGMYPVWQHIWAILTRPMFIISGVFFLVDAMSSPYREGLLYNPLVHIISEARRGFYGSYDAVYVSSRYVYMVALVLTFFGLLLLHRHHQKILDEGV